MSADDALTPAGRRLKAALLFLLALVYRWLPHPLSRGEHSWNTSRFSVGYCFPENERPAYAWHANWKRVWTWNRGRGFERYEHEKERDYD